MYLVQTFCCSRILQYYRTHYPIPSWNHQRCCIPGNISSFTSFLGLFDSFLEFREVFHDLHKGISMVFLTITMAFLSNGCFLAETLFKRSFSYFWHSAQCIAFLNFRLLGDSKFVGISTLMLTFSDGFLSTLLHGLIFGVGICYYFFNVLKNAQQLPNALGE